MTETINTEQFIRALQRDRQYVQIEMANAQNILDSWHGQQYANQRRAATFLIRDCNEKLKHIKVELMLLGAAK
jgi:hypothetical protein